MGSAAVRRGTEGRTALQDYAARPRRRFRVSRVSSDRAEPVLSHSNPWETTTMRISKSIAVACVGLSLAAASGAGAQPLDWNRKVVAIAAEPTGSAGLFDVTVAWKVQANKVLAQLDLSTNVQLFVNTTPVGEVPNDITIDNGQGCLPGGASCGSLCGDGTINGANASLTCFEDGECSGATCDCECGVFLSATFPGIGLSAGDAVVVILVAASGALPDIDTSDDTRTLAFDGDPVFWNRRIVAVDLVPVAGGGLGDHQVNVTWNFGASGVGHQIRLSTLVDVLVNGVVVVGGFQACGDQITMPPSSCFACDGTSCGIATCGGGSVPTSCRQIEDVYDLIACGCGADDQSDTIPQIISLTPGDEVIVLLRPAPGALPELPGLTEDDELAACPWDLDGDGLVGIVDFLDLLAQWGTDPGGPPDFDNDGNVGITDFLALLANWGPCP